MTEFNTHLNGEQFEVPKKNACSHFQVNDGMSRQRKESDFSCLKQKENKEAVGITVKELNHKILTIKLLIKEKFPGLSNLLDEMPITAPENECSKVCFYDLNDYYNSIEAILTKYKLEHRE